MTKTRSPQADEFEARMRVRHGARIRQAREAKALTMLQVASAVGVTEGAVYSWEHGAAAPRLIHQVRLVSVLGVSWLALFDIAEHTEPAGWPPPSGPPVVLASSPLR